MSSTSEDFMVFVVADGPLMRDAVCDLLEASGFAATAFGSAAEYLAFHRPDAVSCLILDVDLPDADGLELQRWLVGHEHPPVIFVTEHGDVVSSVQAMKAGAIDFLTQPFSEGALLAAIDEAFAQDRMLRRVRAELKQLQQRFSGLSPREREVFPLVAGGLLNKQVAARLGISANTLKIHRSNIMRKMAAESFASLVRMAESLSVPIASSRSR
jgi:FixJ family two-component response regulator